MIHDRPHHVLATAETDTLILPQSSHPVNTAEVLASPGIRKPTGRQLPSRSCGRIEAERTANSRSATARNQTLTVYRKVLRDAVSIIPVSGKLIGDDIVQKHLEFYQQIVVFMEHTALEQNLTQDDVLDAYEILERIIEDRYVGRLRRVDEQVAKINEARGPVREKSPRSK